MVRRWADTPYYDAAEHAVTAVDVLQEHIDFCAERFGQNNRLALLRKPG